MEQHTRPLSELQGQAAAGELQHPSGTAEPCSAGRDPLGAPAFWQKVLDLGPRPFGASAQLPTLAAHVTNPVQLFRAGAPQLLPFGSLFPTPPAAGSATARKLRRLSVPRRGRRAARGGRGGWSGGDEPNSSAEEGAYSEYEDVQMQVGRPYLRVLEMGLAPTCCLAPLAALFTNQHMGSGSRNLMLGQHKPAAGVCRVA